MPEVPTYPPGNDYPAASNLYVFTRYGTDQAFTLASGEHLVLATYSSTNRNQIFRCELVSSTNRWGFVNVPTSRRILRNQFEDVRARPQNNPSVWESWAFVPLPAGGFRMTSAIGNRSSSIRRIDENGGPIWFTINPNRRNSEEIVVGITRVDGPATRVDGEALETDDGVTPVEASETPDDDAATVVL